MIMDRRIRLVLALLPAALLLGACGKSQVQPEAITPKVAPKATAPAKPTKDWDALMRRVKDPKARQDKILKTLESAEADRKTGLTQSGAEQKATFKKAFDAYVDAGGLFDELKMDVDAIDKGLWDHDFRQFQNKFDRLTHELKRLSYK